MSIQESSTSVHFRIVVVKISSHYNGAISLLIINGYVKYVDPGEAA